MSFQDFHDSIRSPDLRRVAAHWQAARGSRFLPAWRDIDAVEIGPQLRTIWAWRYDRAAEAFTGRLAGEDILTIFGKQMHGVPMTEYFPPEIYQAFFAWMQRVVVEPSFAHGSGLIYRRLGRNFAGERIILPLAEDGIHGDGIIGASSYESVSSDDQQEFPHLSGAEQVDFFPPDPAAVDVPRVGSRGA